MNEYTDDAISNKEEFELSIHSFYKALKLLSQDAETQCRIMGNYNVAWEIKNEVSTGSYLVDISNGRLTDKKINAINKILKKLKTIPDDVLHEAKTEDSNLRAMRHPCWKALRKEAVILTEMLESETKWPGM